MPIPSLVARTVATILASGVILAATFAIAPAAAIAATSQPIVSLTAPPVPGNPSIKVNLFADHGNAKLVTAALTGGLYVAGGNQLDGSPFSIQLVPPAGGKLMAGDYRIRYNDAGILPTTLPSLRVFYENRQISDGDVDIRDLGATSAGTITRFDITFRAGQGSGATGYSGELRMGETEVSRVNFSAKSLGWNEPPIGYPRQPATEWLRNSGTAAVSIGSPTIGGNAAGDFALTANSCSGHTLAVGATCSLTVGYSPRVAGPRNAVLLVKVGSATQLIDLAGTAPLGTSSITTSGSDVLDKGTTHKVSGGSTYGMVVRAQPTGYVWQSAAASGDNSTQLITTISNAGADKPLTVGIHQAVADPLYTGTQYGESTSVDAFACGDSVGTVTVRAFAVDSFGIPTIANITFTQRCTNETPVMFGTVLWHWKSDITAPAAPANVTVTGSSTRTVTWQGSSSSDVARTILRVVQGSGDRATPQSGYAVAVGASTSAVLPSLPSGANYTVVVFAVDQSGNVSSAASAHLTT
ncbi:MAG: hypothetical protein H7201_16825 [Candidatus Saccharibacteria bacterium]|nr:hypothetical protein [Microbacteriaceae bacterium]